MTKGINYRRGGCFIARHQQLLIMLSSSSKVIRRPSSIVVLPGRDQCHPGCARRSQIMLTMYCWYSTIRRV